jgi:hypothetical protein
VKILRLLFEIDYNEQVTVANTKIAARTHVDMQRSQQVPAFFHSNLIAAISVLTMLSLTLNLRESVTQIFTKFEKSGDQQYFPWFQAMKLLAL